MQVKNQICIDNTKIFSNFGHFLMLIFLIWLISGSTYTQVNLYASIYSRRRNILIISQCISTIRLGVTNCQNDNLPSLFLQQSAENKLIVCALIFFLDESRVELSEEFLPWDKASEEHQPVEHPSQQCPESHQEDEQQKLPGNLSELDQIIPRRIDEPGLSSIFGHF